MSVVIVAGDGRWPLRHGQDPVDLLAENGWSGDPVHAVLGADGRIEVHYDGVALDEPSAPVPIGRGQHATRVHQRVAAYAVVVDEDRLLMSRLADWIRGGAGLWTLPGGCVEPGEEPLDAVARECHEETGQRVVVDELVQVQSQHWYGAGADADEDFHAVRLIYRAHCPQPTPARVVEVDGSTGDAAWVPIDGLEALPQTWMIGMALPHVRVDAGR